MNPLATFEKLVIRPRHSGVPVLVSVVVVLRNGDVRRNRQTALRQQLQIVVVGNGRLRRHVETPRRRQLLQVISHGGLKRLGPVPGGVALRSGIHQVIVAVIARRFAVGLRKVARRPARRRRRRRKRQRCGRRRHGLGLRRMLVAVHVERRQKAGVPERQTTRARHARRSYFVSAASKHPRKARNSFIHLLFVFGGTQSRVVPVRVPLHRGATSRPAPRTPIALGLFCKPRRLAREKKKIRIDGEILTFTYLVLLPIAGALFP